MLFHQRRVLSDRQVPQEVGEKARAAPSAEDDRNDQLATRRAALLASGSISLEQASEFLGQPISGNGLRQRYLRQQLTSGRYFEVRDLHLFDPRGCQLLLFASRRSRPFLKARAWDGHALARGVDFFSYLDQHPAAFVSEQALQRITNNYRPPELDELIGRPLALLG